MSWETLETGWYGDLEDSEKGFGFILCLSWHFLKYYLLKFYHGWNVEMRISFVHNKVNLVRLSVLLMLIKGLCNFRYFTKRGIFLLRENTSLVSWSDSCIGRWFMRRDWVDWAYIPWSLDGLIKIYKILQKLDRIHKTMILWHPIIQKSWWFGIWLSRCCFPCFS